MYSCYYWKNLIHERCTASQNYDEEGALHVQYLLVSQWISCYEHLGSKNESLPCIDSFTRAYLSEFILLLNLSVTIVYNVQKCSGQNLRRKAYSKSSHNSV